MSILFFINKLKLNNKYLDLLLTSNYNSFSDYRNQFYYSQIYTPEKYQQLCNVDILFEKIVNKYLNILNETIYNNENLLNILNKNYKEYQRILKYKQFNELLQTRNYLKSIDKNLRI